MDLCNDAATLVDSIYEAAVVPEIWPTVLGKIAKATGSLGGVLTAAPAVPKDMLPLMAPRFRWTASEGIRDVIARYFDEGVFARCDWSRRGIKCNYPGFLVDTELSTPEQVDTEPSYKFFRSHGIGRSASLFMRVAPDDIFAFSFDRRLDDGPVPDEAIAFLNGLKPHLSRAALTSARIGLHRAQAAADTLDALGLAAAVLSPKHRILAGNALMRELMPFRVDQRAFGRLHLVDRRADEQLSAALANVLVADRHGMPPNKTFSLAVASSGEHPPMIVHVVPIRRSACDIFASAASIVVFAPVRRRELPAAAVIQSLFDLTPAEARVAHMIGSGQTIDRIAVNGKVSEATVRTQLKSVFGKLGVTRQTELANLVNVMTFTYPENTTLDDPGTHAGTA